MLLYSASIIEICLQGEAPLGQEHEKPTVLVHFFFKYLRSSKSIDAFVGSRSYS
jgi:hypothetical protein